LTFKPRVPIPKDRPKQPFFALELFKNTQFLLMFAGAFFCAFAFPSPFFLPSYLFDKGMDTNQGATLLALATGISALGTILGGIAAPRIGTLNVFVVSQFVAALTIFVFWMPAGSNFGMLVAFTVIWGLFWGERRVERMRREGESELTIVCSLGCFFSLLANAAAILFTHLAVFPVVIGELDSRSPPSSPLTPLSSLSRPRSSPGSIYLSLSVSFFTNAPIFGAIIDAGAIYDENGVRVGTNWLYAQIWAGGVYLLGVCFLVLVRMREAKWKIGVKV
jgi:MFS family permease